MTPQQTVAHVPDLRAVPLKQLAERTPDDTLRRVLPTAGTARVVVAAFNASL